MAWIVENRRSGYEKRAEPFLTDDLKIDIANKYFSRYPTKRAVLLPALALDTATFYEEYWLRPKGKYLLQVCRSLSCELCGSKPITNHLKTTLGVEMGETTEDGKFTLVELECLGSCG